MLLTNNSASEYYVGGRDYYLAPGGTLTIPDEVYEADDAVAQAVNNLDALDMVTVSSPPAGYPRTVVPGGDQFNGGTITEPLAIAPESLSEVSALAIHTPEDATADPLTVYSPTGGAFFQINAAGLAVLSSAVAGSALIVSANGSAILNVVDDEGGVSTSGVTLTGATPLIRVSAPFSFGSDPILIVDKDGEAIFRVDGDGSVHIKTGTSIQADL